MIEESLCCKKEMIHTLEDIDIYTFTPENYKQGHPVLICLHSGGLTNSCLFLDRELHHIHYAYEYYAAFDSNFEKYEAIYDLWKK